MRTRLPFAAALAALGAVGCGTTQSSFVKSETTLGRVVVYRNGVAYFERHADVHGDSLRLAVPQDKVDDFLEVAHRRRRRYRRACAHLVSVDRATRTGGTIDMKVGIRRAGAPGAPRRLRLSYVTEAPSWKPSYRVVVGKAGKVELQGWAIVDNTSGEDWRDVKLGVGASSAMSFRFDLKGLRLVAARDAPREQSLRPTPPMGGAAYGQSNGPTVNHRVVADVSDELLRNTEREQDPHAQAGTGGQDAAGNTAHWRAPTGKPGPRPMTKSAGTRAPTENAPLADPIQRMAQSLRGTANTIVVEGYASAGTRTRTPLRSTARIAFAISSSATASIRIRSSRSARASSRGGRAAHASSRLRR